jgi:hypothetical protein
MIKLQGLLNGNYSLSRRLYTAHSGSPDIILKTGSPDNAMSAVDSNTRDPQFREPRYLSSNYPYLLFIPKHYAWRDEVFRLFSRPRHKLPITYSRQGTTEGHCLHLDVSKEWLEMEHCLRKIGTAMLELAPQRTFAMHVSSWFFPGRFRFLRKYRNEAVARSAVWSSLHHFLPLIGYVSMGFWLM